MYDLSLKINYIFEEDTFLLVFLGPEGREGDRRDDVRFVLSFGGIDKVMGDHCSLCFYFIELQSNFVERADLLVNCIHFVDHFEV